MADLSHAVMNAYIEEGMSNFNLFINADGLFQCNVGHRETQTYGIGRAKNPVTAIKDGIIAALAQKQKAERHIARQKKRRRAEDML